MPVPFREGSASVVYLELLSLYSVSFEAAFLIICSSASGTVVSTLLPKVALHNNRFKRPRRTSHWLPLFRTISPKPRERQA